MLANTSFTQLSAECVFALVIRRVDIVVGMCANLGASSAVTPLTFWGLCVYLFNYFFSNIDIYGMFHLSLARRAQTRTVTEADGNVTNFAAGSKKQLLKKVANS